MKKYTVGVVGATGMVGQRFCDPAGKPSLVSADCRGGQCPFRWKIL